LKLYLTNGNIEQSKHLLFELLKEHPMYASFIFETLDESFKSDEKAQESFKIRLALLNEYFFKLDDVELLQSPSVVLSKVRLLQENNNFEDAYNTLKEWMTSNPEIVSEALKIEYIKLLIKLGKNDDALGETTLLLNSLHQSVTKHFCNSCGYNSEDVFWRCPQCKQWETIQFRWKV
jgi:lipopolysaccharide biosynthesis regulator YciM